MIVDLFENAVQFLQKNELLQLFHTQYYQIKHTAYGSDCISSSELIPHSFTNELATSSMPCRKKCCTIVLFSKSTFLSDCSKSWRIVAVKSGVKFLSIALPTFETVPCKSRWSKIFIEILK